MNEIAPLVETCMSQTRCLQKTKILFSLRWWWQIICDSESQSLLVHFSVRHLYYSTFNLLSTTVTTVCYITITSIKHSQMSLVLPIYRIPGAKISLIHSQSQSNQMHCSISWFARFSSRLQVFLSIYEARFSYLYLRSKVQIFIWKRLQAHQHEVARC